MRVSYHLSNALFKCSVSKSDLKNHKEARGLIDKAVQYFNCYQEFYEKYSDQYSEMELFTSQLDNSDEDYKRELIHQQITVQAHQEFAIGKKCFDDAFADGMDPVLVDAAIDCFKRARKLVYDKDYELEAMAEAYLGNIYYKA